MGMLACGAQRATSPLLVCCPPTMLGDACSQKPSPAPFIQRSAETRTLQPLVYDWRDVPFAH